MDYPNRLAITEWAEEDRPREKLIIKGKSALSDAELIAILIGSGNREQSAVDLAKHILSSANNDLNKLAKLGFNDLKKFNGIGEAKAIAIISALELGRRRKKTEPEQKTKITDASEAYEVLKPIMLDLHHEEFWIILLNRANQVIKKEKISTGGISGTVVDNRILFKKALDEFASGIILAHNHPSGNRTPSKADINLTKKLQSAGKVLDIPILDHIIFTDHTYFSFMEESIL